MTIENENEEISPETLKTLVRSILISRSKDGTTISEIRKDYLKIIGTPFPAVKNTVEFLLSIPEVACYCDQRGTLIFSVLRSERSQHILDMVKNQKSSRHDRNRYSSNNDINNCETELHSLPDHLCFFKDNYNYLKGQPTVHSKNTHENSFTSWTNSSECRSSLNSYNNELSYNAHLYDYQLLGDDFFLSMAKMELKCKFIPGHRVYQSGLCVSGQTISDATHRVLTTPAINKRIIVNIGSVDILNGRELIDIQHDFLKLMEAFDQRGISPIITTLAPLANLGHRQSIKDILDSYNEFIRFHSFQWKVIDLWPCMVNKSGQILFECYQNGARYVTGSAQPHVFWNKIGRQRILKEIKKNIAL